MEINVIKNRILCCLILMLAIIGVSSCDSGDIEDTKKVDTDTGGAISVTGQITGLNNWPEGYNLAIAEFKDGDNNVIGQKVISNIGSDGKIDVKLTNISSQASNVELCVTSTLRKRVLTLKNLADVTKLAKGDTIRCDLGTVNLSAFGAIQMGVFDQQCAACHGNSGSASAGLFLTQGKAYGNLVGQPSSRVAGETRVIPGNASESLLHKKLSPEGAELQGHNHTGILASIGESSRILEFIDTWINSGATE